MKMLMRKLVQVEGAEIAEAALVLPVVFIFLLGIIWFGRAFNIYSTITQAAQQGALQAARPICATCTSPGPSNFPSDTTVNSTISAVMQASNLDPSQIPTNSNPPTPVFCPNPPNLQSYAACSTTVDNIIICREVVLNQVSGTTSQPATPVCGTLVSFQYPFQFYLPFTSLNLSQVILTAQAQSRMEN